MVSSLPRGWISAPFLRLVFQNLLVEERTDIRDATLSAWNLVLDILSATGDWLESLIDQQLLLDWYASLMTPLGLPLDVSSFFDPILEADRTGISERHNVDKNMVAQDMSLVTPQTVLRARVAAATALAYIIAVWPTNVGPSCFIIVVVLTVHHYSGPTTIYRGSLPSATHALHRFDQHAPEIPCCYYFRTMGTRT